MAYFLKTITWAGFTLGGSIGALNVENYVESFGNRQDFAREWSVENSIYN